jgi:phosphoribosylformylglycinamidine (FGAM) synthase PurS component
MNKEDFNKFIISEIKKISEKENLNFLLKEENENFYHNNIEDVQTPKFTKIEFETVDSQEFAEEAKEVKALSEEIKRMKSLLNFNNPLLKTH